MQGLTSPKHCADDMGYGRYVGFQEVTRTEMSPRESCSIVIPVYNSAPTLARLVDCVVQVFAQTSLTHEVILVNDGSHDSSCDVIQALSQKHNQVRGIDLMRNYGQHNALLCGIEEANYDWVVTMDDDLQHPPEEIPKLLDKLREGYDVVYGTPLKKQHGLLRNFVTWVTKLVLRSAMGVPIASQVSAFRAFRAGVRKAFVSYRSPFVSLDVLLSWGTNRFASVRVRHNRREQGQSNYTVGRLASQAINLLTGFSTAPLRLVAISGFAFTPFGLLILVYVVGRFLLEGGSVAGFPFLASVIAIFSGAQLSALGVIGEYLGRLHFRIMERPPYVVRRAVS